MPSAAWSARDGSSSWATGTPKTDHHGIADELLDRAAPRLDLLASQLEVAAHQVADDLGVERIRQAGRAGHVGEAGR